MKSSVHGITHSGRMLLDTRLAFDRVAAAYDGPMGNNALIRRMRRTMWATLAETFSLGARLVDLGCGTGLDAEYLGRSGYQVIALDSSPEMVGRTTDRVGRAGLEHRVDVRHLGIQELDMLNDGPYDGMYSNLGALNCLPDLEPVSRMGARLLRPGGRFVVSIIGRYCPWEVVAYLLRGNAGRAFVRMRRGMVPVPLNGSTVWTHYYTPRSFYREFERDFALTSYRALNLFAPPPYLIALHRRAGTICEALSRFDDHVGDWPLFREGGDHFLMIMTKRE